MLFIPQTEQPTWDDRADAFDSVAPHLWPGDGAWSSGLGPTGITLHNVNEKNNGVLTNMDPATDWVVDGDRYALKTDGVDGHVLIPDFTYGPKFNISFWFKVSDLVGSFFQYMFSHGAFGVVDSVNIFHYEESFAGFPVLRTNLRDNDDIDDAGALDIAIDYEDGDWHLYSLGVGSFGSRIYIDGVEQANSAQGGGTFNPTTGIYWGGREDVDPDRFFPGWLDDLFIYNRALNTSENSTLWQLGRGGIFQRKPLVLATEPVIDVALLTLLGVGA
ncbi:LamG domain-containing protein, partial [Candidatus Pacearchaeota archaeon]|nr:LamG domain-containing protein [Candidatus Pacearchaeota archaeon]